MLPLKGNDVTVKGGRGNGYPVSFQRRKGGKLPILFLFSSNLCSSQIFKDSLDGLVITPSFPCKQGLSAQVLPTFLNKKFRRSFLFLNFQQKQWNPSINHWNSYVCIVFFFFPVGVIQYKFCKFYYRSFVVFWLLPCLPSGAMRSDKLPSYKNFK